MNRIRKGDEVVVIAGKDKGKRGVVLSVDADFDKVVVENVNMIKRHTKGNPMQGSPGGIIEKEAPIHISNVAIWNDEEGKADRVGFKLEDDGAKVRVFKSSGKVIED